MKPLAMQDADRHTVSQDGHLDGHSGQVMILLEPVHLPGILPHDPLRDMQCDFLAEVTDGHLPCQHPSDEVLGQEQGCIRMIYDPVIAAPCKDLVRGEYLDPLIERSEVGSWRDMSEPAAIHIDIGEVLGHDARFLSEGVSAMEEIKSHIRVGLE